jgi:hypothetical protein
MNDRHPAARWAPWLFSILLAAAVGVGAYNLGISHALVAAAARGGGAAPAVIPYYGLHPFGFVFPLFFLVFFWFVVARLLFWRGPWRRRWHGDPGAGSGVPPMFDEWHRRAHERMTPKSS